MLKQATNFKEFPRPISLFKMMGPSFVMLALGLGAGELIMWPYLTANYGLGIAWAALLGLTFQYFLNLEIERYALIKGESVFVGLAKIFKFAPYWFIISSFLGFGLPGIAAAAAQVLASVFGLATFKWLAIIILLLIGVILSIGKTVYSIMEKITKTIIFIGVPAIFILAIYLISTSDVVDLFKGLVGQGKGYSFLPAGISLVTFLGAFVYAGAGGNLNLSQSIYIKDKGYGMGKYSQKIGGFFGKTEQREIKLTGENFAPTEKNIKNFKAWWRMINLEHLLVFWLIGITAIFLLMLLSYTTVYGLSGNLQGILFVIKEGLVISQTTWPILGQLFLAIIGIMLFQSQLGVFDSISRMMSENYAIKKMEYDGASKINLGKIYFICVWSIVLFGVTAFLLNFYEPKTLIIIGGVINAWAMFIYVMMIYKLNKNLPRVFQPSWWRQAILLIIFVVYGGFSFYTLFDKFIK